MQESYNLTFDAFIRRKVDHGQETLFHGTDGGSFTTSRCGGRLPAIFVGPGTTDNNFRNRFYRNVPETWLNCSFQSKNILSLTVCSCINGNSNNCQETPAWRPQLKKWVTITVVHKKQSDGKYDLRLLLNNSRSFTIEIQGKPEIYDNVSFYTGQSCLDIRPFRSK